jgi:hypothetical protein
VIALRYLPAVCCVFALALIPTVIHTYSGERWTDGRSTQNIPGSLAGFQSMPSGRGEGWGQRRFNSEDWIEREYTVDRTNTLTLTVVRSYDAKNLYHHPELAVTYRQVSFAGSDVQRFPARPEIPVHVLKPAAGVRGLGMYVLHHGDVFVENPVVFQLQTAVELLFSRRKPMTLFFVSADEAPASAEPASSPAPTLMFAAIDAFLAERPPR